MTRFAVKMELYYRLNYSYHKTYTTQLNRLHLNIIQIKIAILKLCESQQNINDIGLVINYNHKISQPYITTRKHAPQ